jgi:ketosteroid isomerase-like protein
MRHLRVLTLVPALVLTVAGLRRSDPVAPQSEVIIALERGALDRWGKGDPQGYLELYAPEITYFDPMQEGRIDGKAAMEQLYGPIKGMVKVDSYEMLNPRVQRHGDVALLTFNLASHGRTPKGDPFVVRWNSTEVYARSNGKWSIIHSHWSFIKPPGNLPPGE